VDGDGLKITLPPPGTGEKRTTRTLHLRCIGDKLEVRGAGGDSKGTYELERVSSKQ
jgi:hypothetical protein